MLYSKFKKILAGSILAAFTITSIPTSTVSALAAYSYNNNSAFSSTSDTTIIPNIENNSKITTGSEIVSNTTSGSSISAPATPAALSISVPKKVSLYPNQKKALKVTVKNNTTKVKKTFTSKKPSIVKINANGKMTAKKAGTTTIVTKITVNGKKYTKKTKVTVIDAYLTFTSATVLLSRGQTFQFKVKKHNIKKTVTWSVSNSKIASINKKTGKLRAKARGSVLVTATCGTLQNSVYLTIR